MRILLCNDDGIAAPGLLALHEAVRDLGEITVVAPSAGRSASGHAVTLGSPISCKRVHVHERFWGHSVGGSPADCVKLALAELMPSKPDLLISGINSGANVGINVLYSGTVAAAAEGALFGVPSVAVSLEFAEELDFDRAARIARKVIDALLANALDAGALVNINIPALRPGVPRGIRIARQSTIPMEDRFERRDSGPGETIYVLSGGYGDRHDHPETDLHALREGYVAVTALKFDLTDTTGLQRLERVAWPTEF